MSTLNEGVCVILIEGVCVILIEGVFVDPYRVCVCRPLTGVCV